MKKFLVLFILVQYSAFAAGRDCLKEANDLRLAEKVSMWWNSQLDHGEKTIAQICKEGNGDFDSQIELNKILHQKGRADYARKHTYTVGTEGYVYFEDLDGEISNDELCKVLDKHIKENSNCTTPSNYLRALVFDDYKNYEKICLKNLPEQQKRMIACRKQK